MPHAWRRFLAVWEGAPQPVVLRGPRAPDPTPVDAVATAGDISIAARLGALLADGVGDAVQLEASSSVAASRILASELLQATRLRISKADFIACPSCGRTQFDLQSTTARIQARLAHLKGLKIAVMGCIVNGPGEMADADFGYVGSGPGRIDLYVGHERIERNVPQAEAVERLVALIRERGRWVEPHVS
jgi:(E)-4-hydroxy-3-methylbut-2-enyl-diphosphate synthase